MEPIAALLTGAYESIRTILWLPSVILSLAIIGYMFMFGNSQHAKERATWVAIGSAVILGGTRIATWVQGVIH